jgi:hypothetical protein
MDSPFPTYRVITDREGAVCRPDIIETIRGMDRRLRLTSNVCQAEKGGWEVTVKIDTPALPLTERKKLLAGILNFLAKEGALKQKSVQRLLDAVTV